MLAAFLSPLLALTQVAAGPPPPTATTLLRESLALLGGPRLVALTSVRWTGMASDDLTGVSLWAAPSVAMYRDFTELRDLDGGRLRRASTVTLPQRPGTIAFTEIATPEAVAQGIGDRTVPGSPSQAREASAALDYGPERVLLTALAAGDAAMDADTVIAGERCHTVRFRGGRARVFLGSETRLPLAVDVIQTFPNDPTWEMWGDVHTLTLFQAWAYTLEGLRLPHQLTAFRNGRSFRRVVIRELEVGAAAPADSFPVDSALVAAFRARSAADPWTGKDIAELGSGVVFVPGPFNMLFVSTSDGVLVIGAPYATGYARSALAEVARRFPGQAVIGVVLPSGTWPHLGGVREFIARGIPVYATGGAADVVLAVARTPHTLAPDSLARAGVPVRLHRVDSAIVLGRGPNRVRLLPNRGPGAAHSDQLVVYLPDHGLVFAGDLYRPERFEPNLWRQPLDELRSLLAAARITPERVAAMHIAPTPWPEVLASLETGGDTQP